MLVFLGLALVAAMAIVMFVSPFTGLLLYMSWFFVRPQEFLIGLGGTIPLERILALAALASLVLHFKFLRPRRFVASPVSHALLAFLFINYFSLASSIWMSNTLQVVNDLGKIVVFYFLIINLVGDGTQLRKSIWLFLACTAWIASSSIYNYFTDPYYAQGIQRATSLTLTYGDPNSTASNLTLALPFLFAYLGVHRRWWQRLPLVSCLVLCLVAVALTGSRAGVVQVVAAFLLAGLFSRRRLLVLPLGVLVLVVAWAVMPPQYKQRYESIIDFAADTHSAKQPQNSSAYQSAYGRIIGWKVSWEIFKDYPLLGVGAGNFAPAFWGLNYSYDGRKGWSQPHNLPGQVLSELGLLGAITFLFFNFKVVHACRETGRILRSLRSPPPLAAALNRAIVMTVVLLFIVGLSGHNLYRFNWYLIAAFAVVNLRLARRAAEEKTLQGLPGKVSPEFTVFGGSGIVPAENKYSWG